MGIAGWMLVALGLIAAALDLLLDPPAESRLRALGEWWFRLHPGSLQLAQPAIERHVSPALWDPVILTALEAPAALVALGAGAALLLAARIGD
jgi:hypothetical protein